MTLFDSRKSIMISSLVDVGPRWFGGLDKTIKHMCGHWNWTDLAGSTLYVY